MSVSDVMSRISEIQSTIAQIQSGQLPSLTDSSSTASDAATAADFASALAAAGTSDGTDGTDGTSSLSSSSLAAELAALAGTGSTGSGDSIDAAAGSASASNPVGGLVHKSVTGADVLADAKKYLGVPYVFGGTTTSGMDCSGLVQTVFKDLGITMPRVVPDQAKMGVEVPSLAQAKPGDLIVEKGSGHIQIYAGNGQILEAPKPGENVKLRKEWLSESQIGTIRRIVPSGTGSGSGASAGSAGTSSLSSASLLSALSGLTGSGLGSSGLGSTSTSSQSDLLTAALQRLISNGASA
ncbi:C40 family peptidase [Frondihabitans australicus]|uniref:Cell wall-associated NlpC family hydrolase n=1 Tax=Frondihabitans australicus TaxID=386892 RepID=A0A495IHW9_9MICO|nr:C40 family peptidase [Frondihabitans australicus]RKR75564.1 cell wall-associated NlpC family hydrolase [Frondihabitans australicus]